MVPHLIIYFFNVTLKIHVCIKFTISFAGAFSLVNK